MHFVIIFIAVLVMTVIVLSTSQNRRYTKSSEAHYVRAVTELSHQATEAARRGDLATKDRLDAALNALIQDRNPKAPKFGGTPHDDPLGLYNET